MKLSLFSRLVDSDEGTRDGDDWLPDEHPFCNSLVGQLERVFRLAYGTGEEGRQLRLMATLRAIQKIESAEGWRLGNIGGAYLAFDRGSHNIPRPTRDFQGQQYSSCSKAGDCWAAPLQGRFRRNLLIVSWVAPTPRRTANFPGN